MTATALADVFPRPLGVPGLYWVMHHGCPPRWWAWLERCGGGYFHSPAVFAGADGDPFYAELASPDGVAGIAAGLWRRCRLSGKARHVYLPTAPVFIRSAGRQPALDLLVDRLRADGAAEIVMDSFDASWVPEGGMSATPCAERLEYQVDLDDSPDTVTGRFVHHHRRHLKRGEREAWTFGVVPAEEAPDVIASVQQHAADRATRRGTPFQVERIETPRSALDAPWGRAAFGAWHGSELLAAVLVGWGGRRAFYLQGGSTPQGYEADAATWLHWRIMRELTDRGIAIYSLGGAPGSAAQREDPSHGLHRFKTGFGAHVTSCRGLTWVLQPSHERTHALWRWVRRVSPA